MIDLRSSLETWPNALEKTFVEAQVEVFLNQHGTKKPKQFNSKDICLKWDFGERMFTIVY